MRLYTFSDGKSAHSSWQKASSSCISWAVLHELQVWGLLRVAQWYWGQETVMSLYSAVASDRPTWPSVLHHCHVEMSKYVTFAASRLMNAKFTQFKKNSFFDSLLHSYCHQFWWNILCLCSSHIPKHQLSITMFHIRNGGPFTVRLVDSSPSGKRSV